MNIILTGFLFLLLNVTYFGFSSGSEANVYRKITKQEVRKQFDAIKDAVINGKFSEDIVDDLDLLPTELSSPLTKIIFVRRLKHAILNQIEESFSRHSFLQKHLNLLTEEEKDAVDQFLFKSEEELVSFYYLLMDAVWNWNISDEAIEKIVQLKEKYDDGKINESSYTEEFQQILRDEVLEDEKAFNEGNIKPFLNDYELI